MIVMASGGRQSHGGTPIVVRGNPATQGPQLGELAPSSGAGALALEAAFIGSQDFHVTLMTGYCCTKFARRRRRDALIHFPIHQVAAGPPPLMRIPAAGAGFPRHTAIRSTRRASAFWRANGRLLMTRPVRVRPVSRPPGP